MKTSAKSLAPKFLEFLHLVQALKEVERWRGQFFWRDYPQRERYESVADHTWRMALLLAIVEPHLSQPVDFRKTMIMTLIHDLPEMIVGDASPLGSDGTGRDSHAYSKAAAREKFQKEKKAAKKIFATLPKEQGNEFYELWMELEAKKTFEARIVQALDKIEGKLQAAEYLQGTMYKGHQDFNLTYRVETYGADPTLQALGDLVLQEFKKDFKEFKIQ